MWPLSRRFLDPAIADLVGKVEFELPEKLLAAEIESRHAQINERLKQAGLTLDRYLENAEEEADTPEEFWAVVDRNAEQGLRAQILLDAIADEREVGVEQHEFSDLIVRKAQASGNSPEQELQHMMDHDHMSSWMQEIRRNKALGLVLAAATVTDADGAVIDVVPEAPEADDAESDEADAGAEPVAKES